MRSKSQPGEADDVDATPARSAALRLLRSFHAEVDRRAATLAARHAERLHCARGCSACCIDALAVLPVEAERIRRAHPRLLAEGRPHAAGACAFLDASGACRVHADRPYVCRTQGLPLRWFEESTSGEVRERRDICPENAEGPSITSLPDDGLWLLGPFEARLRRIQERFGGDPERVPLRSLFARAPAVDGA